MTCGGTIVVGLKLSPESNGQRELQDLARVLLGLAIAQPQEICNEG